MYSIDDLKQMVFIDIETVPKVGNYDDFIKQYPEQEEYWKLKFEQIKENQSYKFSDITTPTQMWSQMAGLYPEFGKIICISIGQIQFENNQPNIIKTYSFYSDDEYELLNNFMNMTNKIHNKYSGVKWVGHNIKGFDMPYIIKRSIVNEIEVPQKFHFQKQKPWETPLLDTQDIWRFNGFNTAKLGLIAEILNIPNSKTDIDGPDIGKTYWNNGELNRIKEYCERDVECTSNVILKLSNKNLVEKESNN